MREWCQHELMVARFTSLKRLESHHPSRKLVSLSLYKSIFLIVARSKLFATTLFDESKAKRGAMGCSGDSSSFSFIKTMTKKSSFGDHSKSLIYTGGEI